VTNTVDDVTAGVSDTVDDVTNTVDDVADDAGDAAADAADGASSTVDDVTDDVTAGVDDVTTGFGSTVDDVTDDVTTGLGDIRTGLREEGEDLVESSIGNVDTDITDDLTTGGFLSETAADTGGLIPGSATGVTPEGPATVDVSEQSFRERAESLESSRQESFEQGEQLTIFGSTAPDRFLTGAAGVASDVANPAGVALTAETSTEVATNALGEIREEGVRDVAETALGVGGVAAGSAAVGASNNPAEFLGGAAFSFVGGAGASRQIGGALRGTRDRVRTAGGREIPARELASDDVIRYSETDGADGTRFPGAADTDLYRTDPAAAVREQSDEFTPDAIETILGDADGDTTLFKALDVEPDGPGTGRADTGFASAPGETLDDFDYETPGSFFGPELSPNFLGVDDGAGFSLRPGLPDTGNNPTAVAARTDVENPDADTLAGFNQELVDRAGETTARTKPPGEVAPGEIEAVVPPGSEFRPVGSGGVAGSTGARAGVGSEVFTTIGGRRVPIRTVVGDRDDSGDVDVDTDGSVTTGQGSRTLDEIAESVEQPTDRPIAGSSVAGGSAATSGDVDPFEFGSISRRRAGDADVDVSPVTGGSSRPDSGRDDGRGSGGSDSGSRDRRDDGSRGGSSGSSGSGRSDRPTTSVTDVSTSLGETATTDIITDRVSSPTTSITSSPPSTSPPSSPTPDVTGGSSTIDRDRGGGSFGGGSLTGGGSGGGGGGGSFGGGGGGSGGGGGPSPPTSGPPTRTDVDDEQRDRDPFAFGIESEGRNFGSDILSGEEALEQTFGRDPVDEGRDPFQL